LIKRYAKEATFMAKCSKFKPYASVLGAFSSYNALRGFIILLPLLFVTLLLSLPAAAEDNTLETKKELSVDEVARELANPNTPLASLTLKNQYRLYTGDLLHANDQHSFTVLFQPSFPMTIGRTKTAEGEIKDMLFFRPAFPLIIDQPVFDVSKADFRHVTGMADIGFDLMLGRSYPSGIVVGAGIVTSIPTGKKELSYRTWTLGPEGVLASVNRWGVAAIRLSHEWNIGGPVDVPTSTTSAQPILVFLLGEGWVVGSVPEIAYDWKSHEWTVPLNLSGSKTMKFGRTPVKIGASIDYYAARSDNFAPKWMFSFNITPVVPNVIAQWLGLM